MCLQRLKFEKRIFIIQSKLNHTQHHTCYVPLDSQFPSGCFKVSFHAEDPGDVTTSRNKTHISKSVRNKAQFMPEDLQKSRKNWLSQVSPPHEHLSGYRFTAPHSHCNNILLSIQERKANIRAGREEWYATTVPSV